MWSTSVTVFGFAFIFLMTALGAAVVYFFKRGIPERINCLFLGFASGVMLAASVWSLLLPALSQAETLYGALSFLPVGVGFIFGGVLLTALDILARKFYHGERENIKQMRLFFAVTLHNIPEGLAVGFAFGAAAASGETSAFLSALLLSVGIGVQNFPEGAALSLPLKKTVKSSSKAFLLGAASGIAEPVFAVVGYFLAAALCAAQPWLLAFSAGAMVFVAAEDLIPDAKREETPRLGAWGVLAGFLLMMFFDVAFA